MNKNRNTETTCDDIVENISLYRYCRLSIKIRNEISPELKFRDASCRGKSGLKDINLRSRIRCRGCRQEVPQRDSDVL